MKIRAKILCVDDDHINRATFIELLEDEYDLSLAVDGPEALDKIQRFRPDLVLLDIMMPGMNGYEVCQKIRETPSLRHTKVIMISAKAMVAERLEGYDSGADDYMTKPFDHEELLAKIRVHLRLRDSEEVEELHASVMSGLGSRTSTPMSRILGPLELVLSGDSLTPDEKREFIDDAYRSALCLQELFGHVLKLTSLKSRQLEFSFDGESVHDLVNVVTMEYVGGPIDVHLSVDEEVSVRIDHDEMTAVLGTLIDSALDRNPEGARITIAARTVGSAVEISVHDHGPFLDLTELDAAFEEGPTSYQNSLNLRRAAAQYIMWAHGGSIRVDSSAEAGTTYTIALPLEPVPTT